MKKSLIALAALAATASFAQSSVTIDGNLDAGYQSIDYKGTKANGIVGNGSSTSGLNFRGTEDLGGGLKANFRFETNWNMGYNRANAGAASAVASNVNSAAGSFGNGEIRVGLSGDFGAVNLGVVNMNGLTTFTTGQPFGTAIGGGYGSVTRVDASGGAVRSDNSIMYVSPTFNGLNVTLYKANKQTKGPNANNNFTSTLGTTDMAGSQEIGVNYANGPLRASFSSLKQDFNGVDTAAGALSFPVAAGVAVPTAAANTKGTTESTVNTFGANYTMGAARLFVLHQTNKQTGTGAAVDTAFTSASVSYTMGATTLMAQVGQLKADAGANKGKKSDLLGLGADYALSKRTTAYARYESIDDKAGVISAAGNGAFAAVGTETTRTRTAIGVRHAF